MKEDTDSAGFKGWPFHADERREDGEINNGAFNLVLHPESIDRIHEATDENGLRPLLMYLNRLDGYFMTLGCGYGYVENGYYSYLEFTIRHPELAKSTDWPQEFEQKWNRFRSLADSTHPGIAAWLEGSCQMVYRHFYLRPETDQRLLVCMDLRAVSETEHEALTSHVQNFFQLLESGELN